jgi:hypothetical protein
MGNGVVAMRKNGNKRKISARRMGKLNKRNTKTSLLLTGRLQ